MGKENLFWREIKLPRRWRGNWGGAARRSSGLPSIEELIHYWSEPNPGMGIRQDEELAAPTARRPGKRFAPIETAFTFWRIYIQWESSMDGKTLVHTLNKRQEL